MGEPRFGTKGPYSLTESRCDRCVSPSEPNPYPNPSSSGDMSASLPPIPYKYIYIISRSDQ